MSLFRDLNQTAIEANVGKNAYKVFLALLEQTLGYGKSTDRLTESLVHLRTPLKFALPECLYHLSKANKTT